MKTCYKCKIEKNDLDFSKSQFNDKYGQCRDCAHLYYQNNKEAKLKYQKQYREKNVDKVSIAKFNYWIKNKEKIYEYKKNWRQNYANILKFCIAHNKSYYSEECPICSGIRNKKYKNDHKEELNEYSKNYRQNNKENINIRHKNRRENDPIYNIRRIVSSSVYSMIKSQKSNKNGSIIKHLEYSILELKKHLENQFEPWMTWENHGKYNKKIWNDNDPTTWKWQIDHIVPHSDLPYISMENDNFKKVWALNNLRPYSAKQNIIDGVNRTRHK